MKRLISTEVMHSQQAVTLPINRHRDFEGYQTEEGRNVFNVK